MEGLISEIITSVILQPSTPCVVVSDTEASLSVIHKQLVAQVATDEDIVIQNEKHGCVTIQVPEDPHSASNVDVLFVLMSRFVEKTLGIREFTLITHNVSDTEFRHKARLFHQGKEI